MIPPATTADAKPSNEARQSAGAQESIAAWTRLRRARELTWILLGKFALLGGNAVLMLLLAHRLDLNTYGLLVLTIGLQLLISRVLLMGVEIGMIRLSSTSELSARANEVLSAGLAAITITSGMLVLLAVLAIPAFIWLKIPIWVPISIVVGAIGTALVDYVYSVRLVRQEFSLAGFAQGGTSIGRLGLTTMVSFTMPLFSFAVFITYHGASLLSGLGQIAIIGNLGRPWPGRDLVKKLIRYSLWQGKTNVLVIFSLYQGTFLLMLLGQQSATGIFGLGLTLSLGFLAIYNAFFEYLLARLGAVRDTGDLPRFLKRAYGAAAVLSSASVPLVIGLAILVPWIVRPELAEVVPIFYYLAAATILLIFQAPLEVASHYLLRPQLVSGVWLLRAVFIAIPGFVLAPVYGVKGVAIAQLIGSGVALFLLAGFVYRAFRLAVAEWFRANESEQQSRESQFAG